MIPEHEQGIPSDALEWHPTEEETNQEVTPEQQDSNPPSDEREPAKTGPETSLELFQPTADNPVEKITIGLWHTLGHYEGPTRVIVTLKDGRTADMPWEQAEVMLPPEYQAARELGERARRLEQLAFAITHSIRGGTDVMDLTGHFKDALLRPLGKRRKAVSSLYAAEELIDELDKIAQESYLELRRMTNAGESHGKELQDLTARLENCERRLEETRANTFQKYPKVEQVYEQLYREKTEVPRRIEGDSPAELPGPEKT